MAVIVKMDKHGRILLPASIRRSVDSEVFVAEVEDGVIKLKPVKTVSLEEFFDSIEVDVEDFTDTHELRRAVHGGASR